MVFSPKDRVDVYDEMASICRNKFVTDVSARRIDALEHPLSCQVTVRAAGFIEQTWQLLLFWLGLRDNQALFISIPERINPSTLSSATAAIQSPGLPQAGLKGRSVKYRGDVWF
ncbi:hypothetical protein [Burkholderia sp. A9]|uniref:hypothetical protein n=1 Tax=Burkholderia sp. A9 TaxID=1365108 RepID=UPI00126A10B5|nr:hypothetical protein [Burkholderia sp. A9]